MQVMVSAPGKLYLAGEYAVVEAGYPALIMAVDRYLSVQLQRSVVGSLVSSLAPHRSIPFARQNGRLVFPTDNPYGLVTQAMEITETYLREKGVDVGGLYDLTIQSDLDDMETGRKYGLGSSGAVTVAVVKALLVYYQQESSADLVYRLSVLTQLSLGMTGSFGDIAASSFGGVIAYSSPNRIWIQEQLMVASIREVVAMSWPGYAARKLSLPTSLTIMVGWTGVVARTDQLIASVDRQTRGQTPAYQSFLEDSRICVDRLMQACQEDDSLAFQEMIRQNRQLLLEMTNQLGIVLETPALQQLICLAQEQGAVAKTSGAGGGDCGICFTVNQQQEESIKKAWKAVGIVPMEVSIASS